MCTGDPCGISLCFVLCRKPVTEDDCLPIWQGRWYGSARTAKRVKKGRRKSYVTCSCIFYQHLKQMDLELADDYSASWNASFHDQARPEGSRGKLGHRNQAVRDQEIQRAEGEVSQFGALATALASTIGTGNIIGVGTAIASWRPWCSAVVLADWCIWNRNKILQSHLIAVKVQSKDSRWTDAGWCHVCVWRRGLQYEMAGTDLRFFCIICIFWNRLRYTGQCNRNGMQVQNLGIPSVDRRWSRCIL